jgi:quercetin dioxygenase-like cupin family protein
MSTSQMTPAPLASILADEPRRWFLGTQAWIRVGSEHSGGSLAIVEQVIPAGAESPWHVHRTQDESFYVLDGQVTVIVGEQRWTLGPGDYAFGPREVPHGFRIEGHTPARLLLICTPGAGFDRFIHQASEPATAPGFPPPEPPDVARLARLAAEAGNEVLGPLPELLL